MTRPSRAWVAAGLPAATYDELARGLPASRLWSLLLDVAEVRATERRSAELVEQWDRDRFVHPSIVDQRTLVEVDGHLLRATAAFESMLTSSPAPPPGHRHASDGASLRDRRAEGPKDAV